MTRPFFQIQFLLHCRFPDYTDRAVETVSRIAREFGDKICAMMKRFRA